MDVSSISRGYAQYAAQAKNASSAKSTAQSSTTQSDAAKVGDAFELDISDAAKKAGQTQQPTEDFSVEDAGAKATKGLSAEQVDALKADLETQEQTMLNVMIQALTE